jgi:nicotinamidase/pyrazinamidase
MFDTNFIFWNVDTQVDFVEPEGKLYVPGAELLKPTWQKITDLAKEHSIRVVNTADFHYQNSNELSANPDFISTFPEHCMANTAGTEYIAETQAEKPLIIDWDKECLSLNSVREYRNIVIRKDAFDVFLGNPHTAEILKIILPKTVAVYGLTTNVCVDAAVAGLVKRVENVFVITEAIKELLNIPLPFENWKKLGVQLISLEQLSASF